MQMAFEMKQQFQYETISKIFNMFKLQVANDSHESRPQYVKLQRRAVSTCTLHRCCFLRTSVFFISEKHI